MSLKQKLMARLEEVGGSPKKSLGQNFLINVHIVEKIVAAAKNSGMGHYIEVGPGLGSLTELLIEDDSALQLIEMDNLFAAYWRSRGLHVMEKDALHVDWADLVKSDTLLVSNLPYQISARLVIELSAQAPMLKKMVLMFQKEVAERILATPKTADYGFLSVVAQQAWAIRKVVDASPQDFYPPPKVTSRVLSFERVETLSPNFVSFVKKAFENRRKFMLKNFPNAKDKLVFELKRLGYTEKVRAEEISPAEYMQLFQSIKKD